jgi:hypothetical protein
MGTPVETGDLFTDGSEITVLIDEAGDCQTDINFFFEDAARILDTTKSMNAVADAIDGPEQISETSRRLIDTIGAMSVTGTNLPTSTFIPAMESRFSTGMEAAAWIRDAAKKLWEQISKLLKLIWEKITLFYRKMFGSVTVLKRNVTSLRSQLKDRTEVLATHNRTFELSTGLNKLVLDGKVVVNGGTLKSAYQVLSTYVEWGTEVRAREIVDQGEVLLDVLDTFMDELPTVEGEVTVGTDRIITNLDAIFKTCSKAPNSTKIGGTENDVYRSRQILGSFAIVETVPKSSQLAFLNNINMDGMNAVNREKVKSISKKLHELERTRTVLQSFDVSIPYAVEFTVLKHREIEDILDFAEELLKKIEKFTLKGGSKDLSDLSDKIKTSSKRCAEIWDDYSAKNEGKIHAADNANVNAFLAIDLTFARWTKEPVISLIDEALKVTRAVLMVVGKSINQYEHQS